MRERFGKIGVKTTLLFILFAMILCLTLSVFSYYMSYGSYSDLYSQRAQEIAAMAAAMVDGDKVREYYETGQIDEYYEWLQEMFNIIKEEQNVMYLYIFVPSTDLNSFTYILEAIIDTDDPNNIAYMGEIFEFKETEYTYLVPDIIEQRTSTAKIITKDTEWGDAVSAWSPIFDSDGDLAGMVEADLSLNLVYTILNNYMTSITIISSVIVIIMVIMLALFIHRIVTRPLSRLTEGARNFVTGDSLSYQLDIKTGDEMQILSEALYEMSRNIEDYTTRLAGIAADRERIATELNVASNIKSSLLPLPISGREDFEVHALMDSSKEVGGTFYDFFFIDRNHLCLVISGVSDKGIPAALLMVVAKTMIKNQMMSNLPLEQAVNVLNTHLFDSVSSDMSVAAFIGVLDVSEGTLTYVNAGLCTPMLRHRGGNYEFVREQKAPALAVSQNVSYRVMRQSLRQGDRLFLYTDGTRDVANSAGEVFGDDALRSLLNSVKIKPLSAEDTLTEVCSELSNYTVGVERNNDITMLTLEYTKGDRQQAEIVVPAKADSYSNVLPFIKNQLNENGIGGAFYAMIAVALEELFVLVSGSAGGFDVTVRCTVIDKRVEIRLVYGGRLADPRESSGERGLDALEFIEKNMDHLDYQTQDNKNMLILINTAP